MQQTAKISVSLAALLLLTACGGMQERLNSIGKPPAMTEINNPAAQANYNKPVSLPMPPQETLNTNPNSLWQESRQTFFKDQRAHKVGDILTVNIDIQDQANLKDKTQRTQTGSEKSGIPNLLGFEGKLGKILPSGVNPASLLDTSTNNTSSGDGKIERQEDVKLKLAAMITQVLPNGNFVLKGHQEVRVNFELRELTLSGVIRPEDITNVNAISYDKIAEARISYGGRGQVMDIQQPRYGQQFLDAVMPF